MWSTSNETVEAQIELNEYDSVHNCDLFPPAQIIILDKEQTKKRSKARSNSSNHKCLDYTIYILN